jgi:hypothetical protein
MARKTDQGFRLLDGMTSGGDDEAESVPFVPSKRHIDAKAAVKVLVGAKLIQPEDWLASKPAPMTKMEWDSWKAQDGFIDWWYEDLVPKITRNTLDMMAQDWMAGIRAKLQEGDPRTAEWYYETFIKPKMASDGEGGSVLDALLSKKTAWKAK